MTPKHHFRMTTSEIAMGRYMRAPDHSAADEFNAAFEQFGKDDKPAAGAADDKGGAGDGAGAGDPGGDGLGGAGGNSGDGSETHAAGAPAAGADDKGDVTPAADDKAAAAADEKGGTGAGAPADGEPGAAAGADDAAAAAAAAATKSGKTKVAPAADATPGESDDDVLKRLAAAVKKVGDAEPAAAAADDKAQEQPLFTTDEEAKIEHFRKEWPEVAEAFDLQARALAQSVLSYAFKEIGGVINPMRETLDVLATRTHYGDLKDRVGEYTPEERQEIIDWVGQQPTYLQGALKSVIDGGTAEEVADLVDRYRKDTGKQPAGAQADLAEASGKDVELSSEAKQAAAALAPVSTKRTAVQGADDKSDYNGAFAKFADELG